MSEITYLIQHRETLKYARYENDNITWVELGHASRWDNVSACYYLIDVRLDASNYKVVTFVN
jgi:hypothetical protein